MEHKEEVKMDPKEEVTSRPNHLKLISFEVEAYGGLNMTDKALVVHFPENDRITEFSGDQGMGKTSLMNALKALMGEQEPGNAINAVANNKSATLTFEKDGNRYQSRLTKTAYTLKNLKEDATGKIITSTISKPKDILSDLIGPVGVSPDFLTKKKSGAEQIEWIKSLAANNPEIAKLEQEIQGKYDTAYKERTGINAEVTRLRQEISAVGYYRWDSTNNVFAVTQKMSEDKTIIDKAPANDDEIKEIYDRELARDRELDRAKQKLAGYVEKTEQIDIYIDNINEQIKELQEKLTKAENEKIVISEGISKGEEYVKTLQDAPEKLLQAQADMQNAGKIALLKKALADSTASIAKYSRTETEQANLNNKLVEYEKLMQDLAKECTPDIEGLEVITGNIDSKKPTGVYYKGINMAALSESELWDLCLQIWKFTGTSVVYIENSSSLGTDAINRVNWFAEKGGHVFISTMQRGYKELKVSFHNEKE